MLVWESWDAENAHATFLMRGFHVQRREPEKRNRFQLLHKYINLYRFQIPA